MRVVRTLLPLSVLLLSSASFAGVATNGLPTNGLPTNGLPTNGLPTNGLPTNGLPTNGLPTNGLPTNGLPTNGLPTNGLPSPSSGLNLTAFENSLVMGDQQVHGALMSLSMTQADWGNPGTSAGDTLAAAHQAFYQVWSNYYSGLVLEYIWADAHVFGDDFFLDACKLADPSTTCPVAFRGNLGLCDRGPGFSPRGAAVDISLSEDVECQHLLSATLLSQINSLDVHNILSVSGPLPPDHAFASTLTAAAPELLAFPYAYGTPNWVEAVSEACDGSSGYSGPVNCGWVRGYVGTCSPGASYTASIKPGTYTDPYGVMLQVNQGVHSLNYPSSPGGACYGMSGTCPVGDFLGASVSNTPAPVVPFTCPTSGTFNLQFALEDRTLSALSHSTPVFQVVPTSTLLPAASYPADELDAFPRKNIEGYWAGNIFGVANFNPISLGCQARNPQPICYLPTKTGTLCDAASTGCCVPCQDEYNVYEQTDDTSTRPLQGKSQPIQSTVVGGAEPPHPANGLGIVSNQVMQVITNITTGPFEINSVEIEGSFGGYINGQSMPIGYPPPPINQVNFTPNNLLLIQPLASTPYGYWDTQGVFHPVPTTVPYFSNPLTFTIHNNVAATLGESGAENDFSVPACNLPGCRIQIPIDPPVVLAPGQSIAIGVETNSGDEGATGGGVFSWAASDLVSTTVPDLVGVPNSLSWNGAILFGPYDQEGAYTDAADDVGITFYNVKPYLVVSGAEPESPYVQFPNAHMWLSSHWGDDNGYYELRSCSSDISTCIANYEGEIDVPASTAGVVTGKACTNLATDTDSQSPRPYSGSARQLDDVSGCYVGNYPGGVSMPLQFNEGTGGNYPGYGITSFLPSYSNGIESLATLQCATDLAPTAYANVPATVCAGSPITLNATQSQDPNPQPLQFTWTELGELGITLTGEVVTFTPPLPTTSGSTLSFQLTATDACGMASTDLVNISVVQANQAPVAAIVGGNQSVMANAAVSVDGSGSYDPNGDGITYQWTQTAGPTVSFNDSTSLLSFTAPNPASLGLTGAVTLTFQLVVTDQPPADCGGSLSSAPVSVNVVIQAPYSPPVANAGDGHTVYPGTLVHLDGTGSSDPQHSPLSYAWTQLSGTHVTLSGANTATASFIAPNPLPPQETLTFQLIVTDALGLVSPPSQVAILVQPRFAPPDCTNARALFPKLWPPDHNLVPDAIIGVRDDDNAPVSISINSIYSDEWNCACDKGDMPRDAVILPHGTFLVRSERLSSGDGRVYTVAFTATDPLGYGSCSGTVKVCVPHDLGPGIDCVDEGALYNAVAFPHDCGGVDIDDRDNRGQCKE